MAHFIWSIIYIAVGFWILSRVVAFFIQRLLKKYLDVTLRFGKVGLLNFSKVQMTLEQNVTVHVEVEKIWLSSSFFNPEVRKPLVVCMEDMRIQVGISQQGDGDRRVPRSSVPSQKRQQLPRIMKKVLHLASYGGLRINNITVMLLKAMVPDCLIHFSSPEISFDVTIAYDRYELCGNITNLGCKALRSSPENELQENREPQNCLAEFSFTLKSEAKVDRENPLKLVVLKTTVTKPQMMITEGFLQSLQNVNMQTTANDSQAEENNLSLNEIVDRSLPMHGVEGQEEDEIVHWPNDTTVSKLKMFEKLQDVSFDISDLDVKIVRETKQRSLSISLKLFHLGFYNQSFWRATDMNYNVYLEEFNTSSMQAKFAGLTKVILKGKVLRDSLESMLCVSSGFFHYHHEEVQYWVSVFYNIFRPQRPVPEGEQPGLLQQTQPQQVQQHSITQGRGPMVLRRMKSTPKQVPSPTLVSWMANKNFSLILEVSDLSSAVSTAACSGLHSQLAQARISVSFKPGGAVVEGMEWFSTYNTSCEVDIQGVSCSLADVKLPLQQIQAKRHYWGHVVYLGTLLMKLKKFGTDLKVDIMGDNLQLEWSSSIYQSLGQMIGALCKSSSLYSQSETSSVQTGSTEVASYEEEETTLKISDSRRLIYVVKCDVSNINMFVTNSVGASVMTRIDSIAFNHGPMQTLFSVDGTKVQYIICDEEPSFNLSRSAEIHQPVAHIHQVKVKYVKANKECRVHILQTLNIQWRPPVHLCLIQGFQDARTIYDKFRGDEATTQMPQSSSSSPPPAVKAKSSMSINVLVLADITLEAKLSESHAVSICTKSLLVTMTLPDIVMEVKDFCISFDGNNILNITGCQIETLPASHLKAERERAKMLTSTTNRAWGISFDSIDIVFPYKYKFAACYDQVINTNKWLRLVHKVKKKPFTSESPLPADLAIKVKMLSIEISDDPFEVKMGLNYELLKDEGFESKKRKEVMDMKLMDLQKKQFIPVNKREELYTSLYKKSSEIYIQRSQQVYNAAPIRTQLLIWLMEDLDITALADPSFNGKDNVIKHMKEIDSESPFPKEPIEFITLWCRYVSAGVKLWSVSLRDFPRPMIDVSAMHVWGRLIGAERDGTRRAKRIGVVELGEPWEPMKVERNLPALKFFHDFSSDVNLLTMAYGVCWEPAMALFNQNMELINKPSVDPSRPLPFWDKMRLLFHGRLTMSLASMSWLYHASLDPYNNTELMDWNWTNLVLDWKNAQFVLQGDLDISVRTASKYNESRLLHLPNLNFRVSLEWLCLGDANDHHSVMPCAPDKVPDFSLEEHDSFRAFRSQHLNLDVSLKTKPVPSNQQDIPSCPELYASTLRFLEKIKQCMFNVTRPVRRGKLFGVTQPRKMQLTRHYKKIKLSVDFHKFKICHWISNAKEHGAELITDSMVLQMCNRLNLVPLEDGLLHRPRADWSIKYLKCHLGPTQISLCKDMGKDESGASSGVAQRHLLSVAKISYNRTDRKHSKKNEETDQRLPTHTVAIHEMKGVWNQFNRTVFLGLYDSYTRAQALRRNLSSEALKGFRVDPSSPSTTKNRSFSLSSSDILSAQGGESSEKVVSPSPLSKLQMGHAHTMLLKLVSESDSKSVAFTEEPSDSNVSQLHGVRACKLTDILQTNWSIELHNSQVVLKGSEAPGYLIVSAARGRIISYTHTPIWRNGQLRSKSTWNGDVDCMQYYATVDPNSSCEESDNMPWLAKENVEDRLNTDLSGLPEMIGSGQSVGSVVSSAVTGVAPSSDQSHPPESIQLQRIIYRCSCKFFYANYGDVDPNTLPEVPLPLAEETDVMSVEEGVDTFTLLHESVYAYSNPLQFSVIMDIVNNLLLYTEPKKKEASDRLQSMRFKLQLYRDEDQKTPVLQLQEAVREKVQELRQLEKEYYIAKTRDEEERMELLELEMEDMKNLIGIRNEELGMRISCYNESQLQVKAQMKMEKAQQAQVVRRNEVCFKYAKWRMTERDGHCGIAELELRNFVYSKVNRDDDTWTHQLELNWVKVENLLTDNFYQKVLVPRDGQVQDGENRQMALRIFCTERPPVGGIPVKEHLEVNVAPLHIQMTYQFYKAVMEFFFPDKNVEVEDEDDMEMKQKKEKKNNKKDRDKKREKGDEMEKNSLRSLASFSSADDINRMRERAAKNNTFLYVKIPEVVARVSYKGQKEKNIEDVHDFSFILPTVEYHNCIWTWFDFLITLKNHSKKVLLSQAIKQKLHWKARYLEDAPQTDVQEEEDKAKMLLGAKLLAGQDKPAKKGFFGKSSKS